MLSLKNNCTLEQINSLQGLRTIAFFMVLFGHCSVKGTGGMSGVAVSLFFILSGFVSEYAYNKDLSYSVKNSIIFAYNRIKKLYPLHLILLVAMIVLETFEKGGFNHDVRAIILNAFLFQAWFPDTEILNSFNGVTWYLSASLLLYFLFPMLKRFVGKYKNVCQAVLGILFILLFRLAWSWFGNLYLDSYVLGWFQYSFPITRIAEFFIGCHLGYIQKYYKSFEISYGISSILEVLALLCSIVSWKLMKYVVLWDMEWIKYVIIIPPLMFLVYILAQSKGIVSHFLSRRLFVKVGNISGYTYIIHYVVLRYLYIKLYRLNMENCMPILVAMATFVLTVICVKIYLYIVSLINHKLINR